MPNIFDQIVGSIGDIRGDIDLAKAAHELSAEDANAIDHALVMVQNLIRSVERD